MSILYDDVIITSSLYCTDDIIITSSILLQFHDWMLITAVLCLVVLDVVIMTVYTSLEATTGGGASRVPNREQHKTVSGVSGVNVVFLSCVNEWSEP